MMTASRRVIVGVLLAGSASLFSAEAIAETTFEKAKQAHYIRAAMHNEPPYAYMTLEGRAAGLGPETVTAVLAKLGITTIDRVVTPFNSLIPGLIAGRWDIVGSQQTIFPARCQQVAFADPTNTALEGLLVKTGNPKNLHSYDDIRKTPSVKVAVAAGTTELNYLHDYGVSDQQMIIISNHADGAALVMSGRADAYVLEQPSAHILLASPNVHGVELASPFAIPIIHGKPAISYGATTFRKGDIDFITAYDMTLREFEKTAQFREIEKRNGFSDESVKLALAMTARKRCAERQ